MLKGSTFTPSLACNYCAWPPGWVSLSPPGWEAGSTEMGDGEAACPAVGVTALGCWGPVVSFPPLALFLIYLMLSVHLGHSHGQRVLWWQLCCCARGLCSARCWEPREEAPGWRFHGAISGKKGVLELARAKCVQRYALFNKYFQFVFLLLFIN